METSPLRVVVWSTGSIGRIAIRAVHRRPDLDLVGVWVHSPSKAGKDAGDLVNGEPIGVITTGDAQALIDLKPDCVIYAASGPERDAASVPDYVRLLKAGINVVTTSSVRLINPATFDPPYLAELREAADTGGASIYASGIEPGFILEEVPILLATQSSAIRSIHAYEIGLYDDYAVAEPMMDGMGFGRPMDFEPFICIPGAITHEWAGGIYRIGSALGVQVEEIREFVERRPTDRILEVACGTLETGTGGAVRIQAIGIVDGREAITIEHVTRMAADLAPDWPTADADLAYRIEIEGEPNMRCDFSYSLDDSRLSGIDGMAAGAGAMVATAMRVANAVPYVVAAKSGVLGAADLPMTVPHHVFTS